MPSAKHMPKTVATLLEAEDSANELRGVIPKLAELLSRDESNIDVAYLCTTHAVQVSKLPKEGRDFCGYRNIQMLLLALAARSPSAVPSQGSNQAKHSIPALQDEIEQAWDAGFNSHGRELLGNLRGTRKHIGTPEAEALLLSRGIPCVGRVFQGKEASMELLDAIEAYFASAQQSSSCIRGTIHRTDLLPIFLQRPGHSIAIVGIARKRCGRRKLLVFDPAWQPPARMRAGFDGLRCSGWTARVMLKCYTKNERNLGRFEAFETLQFVRR